MVQKEPAVMELEPGDYWWCSCGKSAKQPFCDGAHKDPPSSFHSVKFTIEEKKTVYLCQCKHTSTPPFCDGTHKTK